MNVTGLDLSLTATGIARVRGGDIAVQVHKSKLTGHERLHELLGVIRRGVIGADLICVEGPAFGAKGDAYHQLAGMWWLVTHALWEEDRPVVIVNPTTLKKYVTGRGGAKKDDVLMAVARRWPHIELRDNNGADALGLAAMGRRFLGHPIDSVPQLNQTAMTAVPWPVMA